VNRLLKSITVVFVFAAWITLPSCAPKFNSDRSLQQEANELQQRTLPPGSRLVNEDRLTRQNWGASARWEFESNYGADAYNRWVTSRLRPDFQARETANSVLRFSKYAHGDVEALSVETALSSGALHVAVELEIYPD
jgi:hypothetical protein